jgi:hypothetical protein
MKTIIKKSLVSSLSLILLSGVVTSVSFNNTSVIQGGADVIERSRSFLFSDLTGTLPNSTIYVDINATTINCDFSFTGNAQRSGSTPNFSLAIVNNRTPEAKIIITKPSYVIGLTAIELFAFSGSTSLRYLAINGVKDDTAVTNSGNFDNPINIGKISISGDSVIITSPDGNISIKEFKIYYY